MPKRYVILCNDRVMVFPIKAELNPYDGEPAFCSGEPQFFGGASSRDENAVNTAGREVDEESAWTYYMAGMSWNPVFRGEYENDNGYMVQCEFFYSTRWNYLRPWPSEEEWNRLPNDAREMCWVAEVRREEFRDIAHLSAWSIAERLLRIARQQAPEWARRQMRDHPSEQLCTSLTFDALASFVRLWIARTLPGDVRNSAIHETIPVAHPAPRPFSLSLSTAQR